MSATMTHAPDMTKVQAFAVKLLGDATATLIGPLGLVGDRLGLFETLAQSGPLTADGFAARADIEPRYAREWLSAMACHGYVAYAGATETFALTPEQAYCLVDGDSPFYMGSMFALFPDYYRNVDRLTEAFRHGGGVAQEHFGEEWGCGFERFTRPAFVNNLVADWIPAMPEIDSRLRAGGSVADV